MTKDRIIEKYIQRIMVDYPEADKIHIDLVQFAKELRQCDVVPSYEEVTSEILKWADVIGLPSGYDEDLEKLYKRLSVLWHIR